MVPNKSLDELIVIEHLLRDAHASWSILFNTRALNQTLNKVRSRVRFEGIGFLTKTLPCLGKCLDKALAGTQKLTKAAHGFDTMNDSELPRFLGEFFSQVFQPDGSILQDPDAKCVGLIRQVCYLFYKYELPYNETQTTEVLHAFEKAEADLAIVDAHLANISGLLDKPDLTRRRRLAVEDLTDLQLNQSTSVLVRVAREARILLSKLFERFDGHDIYPRHGPGAVSTKEKLGAKHLWKNVSQRITDVWPLDAYFCASLGHVCDEFSNGFSAITNKESAARVVLVPKDSRGPRLISAEPVDFQWIQQGLRQTIYRLVETNPLTKDNVFFTNQEPNQFGALLGSMNGKYATLDLKEASDRVSLSLVHLLFPSHVQTFLDASRSVSTVLPSGKKLVLRKFAPMGSALCFPIMALCIWALLTASAPDDDTRESILVYGDDVIVPTAFAESAICILESFGLLANRSKCCIQGFFRESCGVDAFKDVNVTPVRLRTVWKSSRCPGVYSSWVAYANSFWDKRCFHVYNYIVEHLEAIYGPIPDESMHLACPSLRCSAAHNGDFRSRTNKSLQKREYKVLTVSSTPVTQVLPGWNMLLRYFSETNNPVPQNASEYRKDETRLFESHPFAVSQYTNRRSSILERRWR